MRSRTARTTALALGDATVLVAVHPRWHAVGAGLVRPSAWLETVGPDVALAALCSALLWLAAAWIALGLVAGLGLRLPGAAGRACGYLARAVLPKVLMRVVLGSTGLGLLAVPAAHAMPPGGAEHAITSQTTSSQTTSHVSATAVPTPSWPVSPAASAPTPAPIAAPTPAPIPAPIPAPTWPSPSAPAPVRSDPSTAATTTTAARVHRGDSLWLLAARRLGSHADAGAVAHYWPQIYATNRSVIGDDPSVIHPGQVLDLPAATQESSR